VDFLPSVRISTIRNFTSLQDARQETFGLEGSVFGLSAPGLGVKSAPDVFADALVEVADPAPTVRQFRSHISPDAPRYLKAREATRSGKRLTPFGDGYRLAKRKGKPVRFDS